MGSADPIELATGNRLAKLPVPGLAHRSVVGVFPYSTPDDYLGSANIVDPAARREAMGRDGFKSATYVGYRSGPDSYGVIVLRFADPDAAKDYLAVHLRAICGNTPDSPSSSAGPTSLPAPARAVK